MCPVVSASPIVDVIISLHLHQLPSVVRTFQEVVPHCPACPGPLGRVNLIYVHKYHTILKGKGLEAVAYGPLIAST